MARGTRSRSAIRRFLQLQDLSSPSDAATMPEERRSFLTECANDPARRRAAWAAGARDDPPAQDPPALTHGRYLPPHHPGPAAPRRNHEESDRWALVA